MSVSNSDLPNCPAELGDDLLAQYHRDGYLAFENVLTENEIESARAAMSEITIRLMHDAREGRLDYGEMKPIEMKAGGAMFFSGMLPHQTPPNQSALRRRALQFQYRGVNTRQVSAEEYGRVFAEKDGTPATCALAEWIDG